MGARALERCGGGERIVRSMTGALAIATTAFASYMIADKRRQPEFAGLEYLSIFNRPNSLASRLSPSPATKDQGVDFSSVGSIKKTDQRAHSPRYRIRQASSEAALIETPNSTLRVKKGDRIDNLGFVAAIEVREGNWAVVMTDGAVIGP